MREPNGFIFPSHKNGTLDNEKPFKKKDLDLRSTLVFHENDRKIHFPMQPDVYEIQVREKFFFWFFKQKSLHNQAAMGNAPAACCKCEEDGWIHVGHVGREIVVSVGFIARDSVCVCGFSSNEDEHLQ